MKIYSEMGLTNFEFWGGAKSRAEEWTYQELEKLEEILEELYPEGISDVTLNDLMWFEEDYLRELIGKPKECEDEEEGE